MYGQPDKKGSVDSSISGLYSLLTDEKTMNGDVFPGNMETLASDTQRAEVRQGLYRKLHGRGIFTGSYEDFDNYFFNPYSQGNQVAALRNKTFTQDPAKEMARNRALRDASRGEYNPYGTSEVSYRPEVRGLGTNIAPIDLVEGEDTMPEPKTPVGDLPKTTRTFGGGVVSGTRGIIGGAQIAVADLMKGFGGNSDDEKEAIHLIDQMEQDGTLSLERVRGVREKLLKELDSYTHNDILFSGDYSKKARQADALKLIEERMQRMGQDLTPEKRAVALDAMRSDLSEKGASEDKENPFVRWKEGAKDYMRKSEVPEGTWAELGSATASVGGAIAGQAISMIPGAAPVGQAISWASIGAQTISSGGQAIMDMEDYAAEKGVYISPEDKATISLGYMAAEFGGDALGGAVASKSISAIGKLAGGRLGKKLAVRSLAKGIAGNEGVRQSLSSLSEYAQKPLAIPLAKSAGRQIVRGAVTEGPGESLTTLAQNGALDRVWKSKEDQEAWADVARQAVKDGIYGAWAGALMGGFGAGIQSGQVARMHRKEGLTLVQDEKNNLYEVIGSDRSSYLVLDRAGRQKMLPADQVVDAIHYTPEERQKSQKAYDEATEGLHPKEEVLTENQKQAGAILSATEQQQSPIYRATHSEVAEEDLNSAAALAGAKQALADVLEGQNEEVKTRVDQMALVLKDGEADPTEELTKLFSDESLSDNDRQSILDVVTVQSRLATIERSHQEAMAQMQRELTKEWSAKSVVGDESARGSVISATITDADGNPKQVYVTGGVRVVMNEGGTVELLPTDDDAPIYVYDESVEGAEKGHIVQMDDLSSPQLVAEDYLDLVQASLDEVETSFRSEVQAAEGQLSQEQAPQNTPEDAGDTTDDFMQSLPRTREGEVDGLKLMSERPDDFIRYLGQLYGDDFVASLPLSKNGALDLKALTPEQTLKVNEAALGKSGAVEAARQRRSKVGAERSKLEAEVKSDLGNLEKRMALRKASEEYRLYDDYVRTAEEQARQELEAKKRAEEAALTPEERQRREEEKRQLAQEKKEREERIRLENERRRREREELERNAEGSTVREYTEDPPRQARARGARLVNGAVVYRQEPMTVVHYADAERAFSQRPGETRVPVKRTIVEAESLQASHKEGQMNPRHFIPEAQPKDRADNGLSSTAADRIASDIRPDEITGGITAYTGAPVVNARGEVIQGNNRTDALQTMYDGEERHAKSAELYKEYLKTHASEYGMTAEQVDAMAHPVAVDVAEVSDSEAIRLGHRGQTDLESAGADTMNAQTVGEELNSDTDPQSGQSMLVSFFNRIFNRTGANGAELSAKMDNMLNRNAEEGLQFLHENGYLTDTQYKNAFETNSEGKRVVTAEAKAALKDVALYQLADVIGPRAMDIFYRLPASARNGLATFLYRDSQASFETSLAPDLGDALLVWDSLRQDPDFAGQTNFESAKIFILGKVSLFGRSELETNLGEASSLAKLLAASMQTQTEEQIAGALNQYYDLVGANETGAKTQSLMPTSQPTDTKAGAAEAVYGRVYEVPSGREKHYRFRRDVAEDFRARRDALADRITEERRKHAAAMDMARTLGVPMKLHEDMSTLPDEVRAGFDETHFVKGWFYKGDNAIHIYLPANVDADDVRATFLHEAVGHYGCRELLGEVGYNQVLDNLANKLGEEEVLRAMSEYGNGSQDLTNLGQVRIAMDEWIAHRAESGITKKTVWESIKDFFRNVFGLSGKQIDQSAEMMADDLLRRSAKNLQKRAERQQGVALEGATQEGDEMVRFKRSNIPAFSGPTLFGETDSRGVRQQLFNADGTTKSPRVRNNVGINVRRESLFADDTRESTTKKSETEGSPQTQEAKQAPKKTLKPSLFGEINKVVPLVSSGQVSIGDFAQTTVEKNSYGDVNSRRESPQNRSVGGEAREEAQRAEPKRVDRSDDGNRSYDPTRGRGLLELFDNEQVEKTSSPKPEEPVSSGKKEATDKRQKPIQDLKGQNDTGSTLPVSKSVPPKNQNNYRVTDGEQPATPASRYKANINAIDLYKKLSEEGRTPTKEEQKVLASYSGWGGLGQYFNNGLYRATLIDKLGKEGFDSAAMSVNSAYYTPFPIINSLWAAAHQLGFRGGNILESSAGIGNILAAIPEGANRVSTIHAVEIDELSGNILDMLYPDAKVDVAGFQNVSIAPGSIDLAITNVPFVSGLNVYDKENKDLSGLFRDLHDFVIAKNVRALRPGGLGVFITSANTLDKSSTLKNWLSTSGSADVIGAFRLNNETFGGTKVTSDIIIIRKRVNGKIDPHAIDVSGTSIYKMSAGTYDSDTHTPITINTYFVNHPEFMGGEPSIGFDQGDTSYRPMAIGVYPTQSVDQDRALSSWVSSLGSIKQEPAIRQQETSADYDSTDKIQGSILIDSSGRICCSDKGLAVPLEGINENKVRGYTKQEAVRDYVELKSALDNLIRYQLENTTDEGIETFIRALNTAYDTFVGKYGYLNDNLGISFIKNNDSEFASVAALEDVTLTDKDDKNGRPIKRYEKTEIFRSRQIAGPKKYKISNLTDGIQVSLYKNGSVDVDFIAESLGMDKETTRHRLLSEGLVYEDPDGGELVVSYLYQSGDIRQKIKIAEEALSRDGGERFESNLKALRAVVPPSIPAHLVPLKLGSTWAPTKLLDDYLKAKTGREATFNHAGDIWTMTVSPMSELSWQERMDIANKDADMGVRSSVVHKTVSFSELVVYALNNGRPDFSYSYKNEYGDRETVRDKEATDLARQKIEDLREDYVSWVSDYLQEKQEVAKEIEEVYNNTFNSYVTPRIPDNMLPSLFEGSANGISLYPHQKRAVLKTMNQSVMLAHEVGTGKTFTLISSAMEMRRLGIAKKPMIVVQNATIGQFASSAKKLYPAAKILALDDTDRGKSGRMRFYGKIKYADWDMVIVPQSTFELIANSPAREEAYKLKRIDEIEHVISVLEDQQSGDSLENNSISQKIRQLRRQVSDQKSDMALAKVKRMSEKSKQKKISNVSARIDKLLDKAVDEEQYFEDLGIDALLIDEAHNYKNLNFSTALGREIKGVTGTSSKKAENVQIKIETIKEKNGGRNVVMATGTPISNTASELWVFMKYLMSEADMRRLGIYYFDDFVNNFGKIQTMLEFTTSGKFKANTRFAGYDGLPELVRIWSSVSDTVLTKEVGQVNDKIPEIETRQDQDVFLDQTPILHQYMNYVRSELEKFENMSGSEKREKSYIPLQMFGKASAAAIDVRLVINQNIDDPHSKLNKAVDELYRTYSETKSYKGTAALFCDKYQNKVSGFNVFEDIKAKLVAKGIPEDQIEIMRPGMTDKKKQAIFDKVNSGAIRIIMGTTPTLGVGVNIQRRLHTLIHLDAPQRPMDYMQRNGRILRQGNLHKDWGKTVRILRFGVKDTLDVTSYQRLKTKAAFIDSIMNGGEILNDPLSSRTIEQEEEGIFDNPVAQLSGVESAMAKMSEERKLKRLRNKKTTWGRDQVYFNSQVKLHEEDIKKTKEYIEKIKSFVSRLDDVFPDRRVHNIKIDGVSAPNVEEAMKLLRAKSKGTTKIADKLKLRPSDNPVNVDFPISLDGHKATLSLVMVSGVGQDDAGYAKVSLLKSVQFECPDLGISRKTIDGTVSIPNAFEKVINDIISGEQSERQLNALTDRVTQKEAEKKYAEERLASNRVFPEEKELQETERRVAELTKQMNEELRAKEEKYANLDSDEETIDFAEIEADATDEEDDGFRFRTGKQNIEEVNRTFNEELLQLKRGELKNGHVFMLGIADPILRSAGVANAPIEMKAQRLLDKGHQKNHPFNITDLYDLPRAIQDPIMVFRSKTVPGRFVVLVEQTKGDVNYVVALGVEKNARNIEVNDIRSVYPKDRIHGVIDWIIGEKDLLRYAHKTKAYDWLSKQRSNFAEVEEKVARIDLATKIVRDFENPKVDRATPTDPKLRFRMAERAGDVSGAAEAASDFVRNATPKNTTIDDVLRFKRVYHNSPHLLKKADGSFVDPETGDRLGFDHRFMGSGEGAQAHGWGSYFSVKDLADYASTYDPSVYQGMCITQNDEYVISNGGNAKTSELLFETVYGLCKSCETAPDEDAIKRYVIETITSRFQEHQQEANRQRRLLDALKDNEPWAVTVTNAQTGDIITDPKTGYRYSEEDSSVDYVRWRYEISKKMEGRYGKVLSFIESNPDYVEHFVAKVERHKYAVEIPDPDTNHYIREDRRLTKHEEEMIRKAINDKWELRNSVLEKRSWRGITGKEAYKYLSLVLGAKQASLLLNEAGFVGIHYNGHIDGECYVIFNEKDAKITEHVRFRRTSNAERLEIERKAKADGSWLLAPDGTPTTLSEEGWIASRSSDFRAEHGDWSNPEVRERSRRIDKLLKSDPIVIPQEGVIDLSHRDRKEIRQWAKENLKRSYTNRDTGDTIMISTRGIKEASHHGMSDNAHKMTFAYIPQMIENSIFLYEDHRQHEGAPYAMYRYYVAGMNINGEDYTVRLSVGVDENGRRYYDHGLTQIEKKKLVDFVNQPAKSFTAIEGIPEAAPQLSSAQGKGTKSSVSDKQIPVTHEGQPAESFISMGAEPSVVPDPSVAPLKDKRLVEILQGYLPESFYQANGEPKREIVEEYLRAEDEKEIRYRRVKADPMNAISPINPQWDGEWYSPEDLTGKSTADLLELPAAPATPEKLPTQSVAEYAETMSRHNADPRVRFRTGAHKENLRAPQPPRITDGMSLYEVAQLQHEYNRNYRDYLSSSMKRMDALVTTKGRFIRYMVDSARPVELFCKEMERMGIGMTPEQNVYQDLMTQSSRELNIRKQEVEPLVTKLTDRIRDLREQKLLDKVMDVSYTFTDGDTEITEKVERADGYDKVSLYFQAKDIVECEQLGLVSRGREGFEDVVTEFGKSSNHITPEAYIASFEAAVGKANAEALCDDMRKMSRWSIDRLHGAGLMTDDQYRSLTQSPRRYYAPQRGFKVTEESDRNAYERVEMTAEGRQSLSGDPIAYMQAIMNTTVMRVVRNQDLLHLYEWVTQHQQELARRGVLEIGETYYRKAGVDEKGNPIYTPSKQAPTIEELRHDADARRQIAKLRMDQKRLDQSNAKGETADYVYKVKSKEISDKISDLNNSIEILYRDPKPLRGNENEQDEALRRTVKVYKDGVEQQIHFSPQYRGELVADVLNGRPSIDKNSRFYQSGWGEMLEKTGQIKFVSKATRFMSALMTQYNPNFAVTNALRDYGTALISNVSDFGWDYQRAFMANYAKVQKTVLKYAMSDAYSDGTYPSGKYGTYLKEFFDEGAATGWSFLPDVVKIRQTMKEMSDPSLKQKLVNGKFGVANAFGLKQGIGMITEASELNTRFAEYVTSRERGYSKKEAAKHAKELTVNFNRKGALAGVFGSFFGFWNASIQGTNKIVRLGKPAAEWCGTLFAGGLAQAMLYALIDPDKDDERAFTEWEMMTNLCMGDVKIPLPQGFRGFWGAGVQMALAIAGKKDWQESVIDGMQFLMGELLPNEVASLTNVVEWDDVTGNVTLNSKQVARDVMPTSIQPVTDVFLNMDFMGNQVYYEPFVKNQEGQVAQRTLGKKRTKQVYKDLSDKIWYAMGGSLERNDRMSRNGTNSLPDGKLFNPSVIEHVFEGYTTGVGKTLADIATGVSAVSSGDLSELRKLQIVNVLTKQEKDYSDSDRSYWKLMDFYRSRQQTMSNLRKAKEGEDLERYREMTKRVSELAPRMTGEQLTEKIWEDGTKDEKLYVTWLETKALLKQIDKGTVTKEEVAPTIDCLTEQFRELR